MDLDESLVHLEHISEEGGYLQALVALHLNDLAQLFVFNNRAVRGKFLQNKESYQRQGGENNQQYDERTFLNAFKIFFKSYSAQMIEHRILMHSPH